MVMTITKNILRYSVLGGLFLIPFIPFIVPGAMFFPFITGKGFAFRIIVEIIFGLFVALAFLDPGYRPKNSWITKAVLFFTCAVFIGDIFSVNPYKSLWSNYERMEGFVLIIHLALYYITASSVLRSFKQWNQFFNITITSSVVASFYAVYQLLGKATINQGGVRVDGTFGNATYFAIYLVFHIFLCLYMLIDKTKPQWQRWCYGLGGLLEMIILYYTATRGAILGLIGGLVLTGLIILWKDRKNLWFRKISYWTGGAFIVFLLVFISIRQTTFVQTNPVLSRFASLSFSEIKTQGRYFVWPMAIKGFVESPKTILIGWGQESFNFVFNKYYDPRMYAQEQWFDRTHDVFLDWLIAGGLLGFLSYASLYISLFYYIWKKDNSLDIYGKSIFTGMIAAYIFHNIFVFDNLISYIMFFSILAYLHSISTERVVNTGKFYTKTFSDAVVGYVALPLSVIAIVFVVYVVNIPALLANQTLIRSISPQQGGVDVNLKLFKEVFAYNSFGDSEAIEQLAQVSSQINSAQIPESAKKEFFDYAKEKIEEKIKETPTDTRYLVFAGSFFNRFGKYDDAIKYLNEALKYSPKKTTIYFEIASSYLGKGDTKKMEEVIKQGYDLETNSPESQTIYAIAAIYNKDVNVLKILSAQIDPNTIISDNRFIQAYANIGDYDSAITILNARAQKDPNNTQTQLSLASVYATIGQKQKAVAIIQAMIEKDPTFKTQGEGYIKQIKSQ